MADLENDLLEAAGINKHSLPPSSKNQFFDSGDDDSEDDFDDDASQSRRKKRGRDDDDDASDDDGGSDREVDRSDESDVGDDLYKDEDDRKKLSEMTELQREMILSDRAAKKDDKDILSKIASKREKGNMYQEERLRLFRLLV
jgi:RNA polymerase-associated protein RTF1